MPDWRRKPPDQMPYWIRGARGLRSSSRVYGHNTRMLHGRLHVFWPFASDRHGSGDDEWPFVSADDSCLQGYWWYGPIPEPPGEPFVAEPK